MRLKCDSCSLEFDLRGPRWKCDCGGYLLLNYSPKLRLASLENAPSSLWRYGDVLPIGTSRVSIGESITPLSKLQYGQGSAYFKLDYLLPTGSYKDRGMSVMVSSLVNWHVQSVIEDSSGNAGASLAAYSSKANITADIYVPSYTSIGKLTQVTLYGANLIKVPGTREDTTRAALEAAEKGKFYASHNWSPFFEHGVKTFVYEIWEQLGMVMPDVIVVPCGNGSLVTSAYLAAQELVSAKLANHLPRLVAVQSENCAPLATAWKLGMDKPVAIDKKETAAEGISSLMPIKGSQVLHAVRETDGIFVTVSDDEIWDALYKMAKLGVFIEPTSAVAPAAFEKLAESGWLKPSQCVAVELSGSGLKAIDKCSQHFDL
jgi:threonine synthase